ncbi:MAG: potassium transporter, partial [Gammaproteobacteria bacterium]
MHAAIILRLIGQLLMLFSITLLPPVIIDIFYREDAGQAFFYSYLLLLVTGFGLWLPVRTKRAELRL